MKMDEAIKKLLKKLKRDQTEMARLMNIVLEEGMESLEKREFYRLEVLKKEVGDTLEEIENNPSVSISVKVKLTQIEKRNKETVRQVESISVQNSSEEIFILLQLIMENQDSDRKLKDYINHIKEQQKRINKFKKKLVYEDSLSKLEIEKLRELEEDIKIKIQQLRDSKDLSTSVKINIEKLFEKKTSAREFLEEKLVVVEKKDEFESIDDLEKMLSKLKTQVSGGKKCIKCCDPVGDDDLLLPSRVQLEPQSTVRFETLLPSSVVMDKYKEMRDTGGDNTTFNIAVSKDELLMMAHQASKPY